MPPFVVECAVACLSFGPVAHSNYDTVVSDYTGTLAISQDLVLHGWNDSLNTRLLRAPEALDVYRAQERWARSIQRRDPEERYRLQKEGQYWLRWLQASKQAE